MVGANYLPNALRLRNRTIEVEVELKGEKVQRVRGTVGSARVARRWRRRRDGSQSEAGEARGRSREAGRWRVLCAVAVAALRALLDCSPTAGPGLLGATTAAAAAAAAATAPLCEVVEEWRSHARRLWRKNASEITRVQRLRQTHRCRRLKGRKGRRWLRAARSHCRLCGPWAARQWPSSRPRRFFSSGDGAVHCCGCGDFFSSSEAYPDPNILPSIPLPPYSPQPLLSPPLPSLPSPTSPPPPTLAPTQPKTKTETKIETKVAPFFYKLKTPRSAPTARSGS